MHFTFISTSHHVLQPHVLLMYINRQLACDMIRVVRSHPRHRHYYGAYQMVDEKNVVIDWMTNLDQLARELGVFDESGMLLTAD